MKAVLRNKPEKERSAQSEIICRLVKNSKAWRDSHSVMLFMPLKDEVDVDMLLNSEDKEIFIPRVNGDDLEVCRYDRDRLAVGAFGILEPATVPELVEGPGLVLVPGLAFTKDGKRMGRGKGFYDRFLAGRNCLKYGIAFPEQIVDDLPVEPHDVVLDGVFTIE